MPNQECTTMDPAQLAEQARTAYEQKRTRECIELTKALELVDPGNEQARSLQTAIQADMRRDLDDARALLEQSVTNEGSKYRRAAELILLKLLRLDPDNQDARALLQSVRSNATPETAAPVTPKTAASEPHPVETPQPAEMDAAPAPLTSWADPERLEAQLERKSEPDVRHPEVRPELEVKHDRKPSHEVSSSSHSPAHSTREEVPFTAAVLLETKEKKTSGRKIPVGLIVIAVLVVGVFLVLNSRRSNSKAPVVNAPTESVKPSDFQARTEQPAAPVQKSAAPTAPSTATPTPTASALSAAAPPADTNAASTTGKLAVSSATSAEIYMGNKYVGSTPTTLELPAGRQTLEYRHGDLRTVVSHDIKLNSTITATVTFQVTVQVNAKPWAQVFLDGTPRRALGQTPLSGITVPIGGVLVFENPSFATKSYRITDKDTAIQVDLN